MRVRCICMQIVHHYSRHVKSHSRVQDLLESPSGKIFSNLQQSCNKENPEQFVVVFRVKGGLYPWSCSGIWWVFLCHTHCQSSPLSRRRGDVPRFRKLRLYRCQSTIIPASTSIFYFHQHENYLPFAYRAWSRFCRQKGQNWMGILDNWIIWKEPMTSIFKLYLDEYLCSTL